jgi:hypothetical protein
VARVKRAVNAQKKRRVTLERASGYRGRCWGGVERDDGSAQQGARPVEPDLAEPYWNSGPEKVRVL